MMPRTHFLFGLLIGVTLGFFIPLDRSYILFAGFISMAYDLDHVYAFWKTYGRIEFKNSWNNSLTPHIESVRTVFHSPKGTLLLFPFIALISVFNARLGALILLTYFGHVLLDWIPPKFDIHLEGAGWIYPLSFGEVRIDMALLFLVWLAHRQI